MRYLVIFFFSMTTLTAWSQVDKAQVEEMLQEMVKQNVISNVDAEKAKIKLQQMNETEWKTVNEQAKDYVARNPASVSPVTANPKQLDGAQINQIQEDLNKMMPKQVQ